MTIDQFRRKVWRKINRQPESNRNIENPNLIRGGGEASIRSIF